MGSGMTTSTATKGRVCEGYIKDNVGLRIHEECDVVLDPNFGFLQVRCDVRFCYSLFCGEWWF